MFTGWRICLEAVPTPSCHQGSSVAVPTSPAHMSRATYYSLLTFSPLSDASADHFNLILFQSQLCWVAGPLPAYSLGSYPLFPRNSPSFLWQRAWGGDEGGWDSPPGMFLIPQAATSVHGGLTTQALFIQTGGPCVSSEVDSASCGCTKGMDTGRRGYGHFLGGQNNLSLSCPAKMGKGL